MLGERLDPPTTRIYLTGRVSVEVAGRLIGPEAFPGQQGRVLFACLVLEQGRPITRAELAEVLWPGALPNAWESALSAVVSKLRTLLARSAPEAEASLLSDRGAYELRFAARTWVDIDSAADAIHEAEASLRADDPRAAYGPSAVALHIARRPFLPGEQGPWIEGRRDRLRDILLRALEARTEIYLWNAEHALALQTAKELVGLEPFREAGHRLVMRSHCAMGNSAEALRAYERCRRLIARELGVDPSPQTKAVYEEVLAGL